MKVQTLDLDEFKKYAAFLLANPAIMQDLTEQNFRDVQRSAIPLLQFFSQLPEEEFRKLSDEGVFNFLRQVLNDQALAEAIQSLENWKADQLPGIPKEKIEIHDIVRVYALRKMLFLDFLPRYTSDIAVFTAVTKELEYFHSYLEEYAFQTFVDIQQEVLFKEKEFIASLIDNSVDGILAFDAAMRITEWNKVMQQWNKLTKSDVLGKKVFALFPQFEYTDEGQAMLSVFRGEQVYIREKPFRGRKGYYEANVIPLYDKQGSITGGVSIIHDITQRREAEQLIHEKNQEMLAALEELTAAEEQLREANEELERRVALRTQELAASEEEMRQTLDNMIALNDTLAERENFLNSIITQSPLSTWIADAQGTQIQVNQACLDLFGIPDATLSLGKYNILKDEVLMQTSYYQDIVAVFSEGKVVRFEGDYDISKLQHVRFPTGKPLSLIGTIFPIKNAEGQVTHAVIQHEDVTEKKKAELALKQSEEQLRLITDALPVLISYIDAEKRFRFANQAYADWFQQSKAEIIGKKTVQVVGEKAYQNADPYMEKALAGEQVSFETIQDYGVMGTRYISANLIPHIVDKEVKGIYALTHDISERQQVEQTLKRLYKEARKRNQELKRINTDLDNFIYTASHDLKSPVANLEGLLNLMLSESEPEKEGKETKVLQMMELSINKLKRTIEDLVEITKVQKEMEQPVFEKVCFGKILEDIKTDIHPLIKESDAEIIEDYAVPEIHYPKSHLRSILYNLLSNALKYRSPHRRAVVVISTSDRKNRVLLSVRDNGLGMSETQQKKLFTMFKRLHTHVEGTGIGLYTIKRIIENKGGSIQVHSQVDKGTAFIVSFIKQK